MKSPSKGTQAAVGGEATREALSRTAIPCLKANFARWRRTSYSARPWKLSVVPCADGRARWARLGTILTLQESPQHRRHHNLHNRRA